MKEAAERMQGSEHEGWFWDNFMARKIVRKKDKDENETKETTEENGDTPD
jgi:hypothetical protein